MKKRFFTILCIIFVCSLVLPYQKVDAAKGISVTYHSQAAIRSMYRTLNPHDASTSYLTKPRTKAPYAAGTVSASSQKIGLNSLNFIRYVAGIPYNVTLNATYKKKAQAAALINEINGTLSHYPYKPSKMSQGLANLAKQGARNSNLGRNYTSFYDILVRGFMADKSNANLSKLGHRRWILNPKMSATGFGQVGSVKTMYATDKKNSKGGSYKGIAWPAQNMPVELFDSSYPWSISMGKNVNKSKITVTLKRKSDGKVWKFSNKKSNGVFYVNNANYGIKGCIIFRPSGIRSYQANDTFSVTITGGGLNVSYNVKFFSLKSSNLDSSDDSTTSSTETETSTLAKNTITAKNIVRTSSSKEQFCKISASCKGGAPLSYTSNNKKVTVDATGQVTIAAGFIGSCQITIRSQETSLYKAAAKRITVTVNPARTTLTSLNNPKGKKIQVRWKKNTTASGYQIQFSLSRRFNKSTRNRYANNKKVSQIFTGFKKGKTYYVRIRCYRAVAGKKYYSAWSAVKQEKIQR